MRSYSQLQVKLELLDEVTLHHDLWTAIRNFNQQPQSARNKRMVNSVGETNAIISVPK